jgi:two-component sensor histidine kinase/CHASE3 domain sensor protein
VSPSNLKLLAILAWSGGFAALLAAMLGAAIVWLSARIQTDEQKVRNTLAVQNQVARILSLVQHVETDQRGYLLTERSIYLDSYEDAETTLFAAMDGASKLVADSPRQQQTLARLRRVVIDRLDEVRSTIDAQHAGHPDAARAIVNSDRGLKMTAQIHRLVSEIKSEEDRSLSIREAASKFVGTLLQLGAATAFVLTCATGMMGCIYIWRSFSELKMAHDQLGVTNEKLIAEMQEREQGKARLQLALDASRLGWWQYDPLRRVFSLDNRSKDILNIAEDRQVAQEMMRLVHVDDAGRVRTAFQTECDTTDSKPHAIKFRTRWRGSEVRWVKVQWRGCLVSAPERPGAGVVGTIEDINERMAREEKTHLLMREINHRAKNMLSVVDSIAHQTAAKNPEDFVERFSDRIQALSANQDLLVHNEWNGVNIEELVRAQLAHYADLIGSRIEVDDQELCFNPASAQAIGLALHELVTNAGKYGALSTDTGRVDINWGIDGGTFTMSWTERGGPPVSPPVRRGFGTVVMGAMVERSLDGAVELDYVPSGVIWRLTCPSANALEPSKAS